MIKGKNVRKGVEFVDKALWIAFPIQNKFFEMLYHGNSKHSSSIFSYTSTSNEINSQPI